MDKLLEYDHICTLVHTHTHTHTHTLSLCHTDTDSMKTGSLR